MLGNFIKATIRQITGNWLYSAINVFGLAIGVACCLLILLYVRHELSYESGFDKTDRIYRISREIFPFEGARLRIPATNNGPVAPALLADYPDVIEEVGRIYSGNMKVVIDEQSFQEPNLRFGDQAIVDIFGFDWIAGNSATALEEPNSLILTETLARKYFGSLDVLGKQLRINDRYDVRVTGIIRDLPDNTHLSLGGLLSLNTITAAFGPQSLEQWNSTTDFHTYVLLKEGASIEPVVADTSDFLFRHAGDIALKYSTMRFLNVRDIHLRSDRDEEWQPHGSIARVYSFAAIAFAILVMACINFTSIATTRSSIRAREVAMRKTLGSTRAQLVVQFLGEAGFFACLSMVLAVGLAQMLLPAFRNFASMELSFDYFKNLNFIGTATVLALFITCLAGSYPAFYLAGLKPARVLKSEVSSGRQSLVFRNVLVVLQFSIAIVLLICTAVIFLQRQLADNIELGFNKDGVVLVTSASSQGFKQDWLVFKQELLTNPSVEKVTTSHFPPFSFNDNQVSVGLEGGSAETRIQYMLVDYDFFSTYEIPFVSGRAFSRDMGSDTGYRFPAEGLTSAPVILNEAAVSALGQTPQTIVGRKVGVSDMRMNGEIVGVVGNTLFESVRSTMRPLIFVLAQPELDGNRAAFRTVAVKIKDNSVPQALPHIEAAWQRVYPGLEFNRRFLDDDFQVQYQAEEKQAQLLAAFSILAIVIACFGLFSLASFNAERRRKEIGVRKVMGGSVLRIVLMLTNEFSRLVLISNIIAWPVAYILMSRWLENYAYRIDISPAVFIGGSLIALCIAWVTVGSTAARAAIQNPIIALRYE
jgi:putative ABC transport system permease protein